MSLRILVDMNLSPRWVTWLREHGQHAVHWTEVGECRAPDSVVLAWAQHHEHILFTHDLDFGAILAASRGIGPSVIQLRAGEVTPEAVGAILLEALTTCEDRLKRGAIISLDENTLRLRVLPLR
jgi:predicted nuclease of predicted toxin-antitoxin system